MATKLTLVVIRVAELEKSVEVYRALGLPLVKEQHGKSPEHYSATVAETTLELYPLTSDSEKTRSTRLGFSVDHGRLDEVLSVVQSFGCLLILTPKESPWGRRAVIEDLDGHKVELIEASTQ